MPTVLAWPMAARPGQHPATRALHASYVLPVLHVLLQYNVEEYTREVAEAGAREAVQQFTTFDWSRMDKLGLSLVRAVAAAASAAAAAVAAASAAANVAAAAAAAGASGAAALLLQRQLACLPGLRAAAVSRACAPGPQVNNVYQDSDPDEYPLTDADLSLGFEVLGCLVQVGWVDEQGWEGLA